MSKRLTIQSLTSFLLLNISSLMIFHASVQAELFNSAVDRLPVNERVDLRAGKVVINGENGKYVAKILVTAPTVVVWSVLTDFQNFAKFLPHV